MQEEITGFSLTPHQSHLWRQGCATQLPCSVLLLSMEGVPDIPLLKRALDHLVQQHEILRTRFKTPALAKLPIQVITEQPSDWNEVEKEQQDPHSWALEAFVPHNTLAEGPTCLATLFEHKQKTLLRLALPAVCCDGYSQNVMAAGLAANYRALVEGREPDEEVVQYTQYGAWLQSLVEDENHMGHSYWRKQRSIDPGEPVPRETRKGDGQGYGVVTSRPSTAFNHALNGFSGDREAALLTGWQLLLARLHGVWEMPMAVSVNGRSFEELETALGLYARYLPTKLVFNRRSTFGSKLESAAAQLKEMAQWQDFFGLDHGDFDVQQLPYGFDWESGPRSFEMGGLKLNMEERYHLGKSFRLKLEVRESVGSLEIVLYHDRRCWSHDAAVYLLEQLSTMLEAALTREDTRLVELPILSERQRARSLEALGNATMCRTIEPPLAAYFEKVAQETPQRWAVLGTSAEGQETRLTYGRLNRRANRLAHRLRSKGVGPEEVVALFCPRTVETITALLAVLKVGAAYLAIDPLWPPARIQSILDQAGVRFVLTRAGMPELPTHFEGLFIDEPPASTAAEIHNETNPVRIDDDRFMAYLVFTSGSTGEPKGVAVTHGNLRAYLASIVARFDLKPGWTYGLVSSLAADLGNTVLYPSLFHGGTLYFFSDEEIANGTLFADRMRRQTVDALKITPGHLEMLTRDNPLEHALPREVLIMGGEAPNPKFVDRLRLESHGGTRIVNHYGPSETTVGVTAHTCREAGETGKLPLGYAFLNATVLPIDGRMALAAPHAPAELFIGGATVTRGYRNRPALTAERFLPDPFSIHPGARIYRSGDLGFYTDNGNLTFLGRGDRQVKIGGYRVELGEIEAALCRQEQVGQAVALVDGKNRLRLFAVTSSPDADTDRWYRALQANLPSHMVPVMIECLDRLPLTTNGKIDRGALAATNPNTVAESGYASPRNPLEEKLCEIWARLLSVERVGIHDNFFQLGGHSLLSIRLISSIQNELNFSFTLSETFLYPTVSTMAAQLGQDQHSPLVCLNEQSTAPPLFLIHPSGGEIHWYFNLANRLADHYRCYGIQAPGLFSADRVSSDLAAISQDYIGIIRAEQPHGPYRIGGWSIGGSIAVEIAARLEDQGETVEDLILIDAFQMADVDPGQVAEFALLDFVGEIANLWDREHLTWINEIGASAESERMPLLYQKLQAMGAVPEGLSISLMEDKFRVYLALRTAVAGYRPRPYNGRVRLIRAHLPNDTVTGTDVDQDQDMSYGWQRFGFPNMLIRNVHGNHYSIFHGNNLDELVELVSGGNALHNDGAIWYSGRVQLSYATEHLHIDRLLRGLVGLYEASFPGRIHSHYLIGSHAENDSGQGSDVDLIMVFKGNLGYREHEKAMELAGSSTFFHPNGVDIRFLSESQVSRFGQLDIEKSRLLFGNKIEVPPLEVRQETNLRFKMYSGLVYLMRVRGYPRQIFAELKYPDSEDFFFGYCKKQVLDEHGNYRASCKELVATVAKTAMGWLDYRTRAMVVSKRAVGSLFEATVDVDWGRYIQEVVDYCRNHWFYVIPETDTERERLRNFCSRALDFETAYLAIMREFLLDELHREETPNPWLTIQEVVEFLGIPEHLVMQQIQAKKLETREYLDETLVYIPKLCRLIAIGALSTVIFPDHEVYQTLSELKGEGVPFQNILTNTTLAVLDRLGVPQDALVNVQR